jgi:hypothetical protein
VVETARLLSVVHGVLALAWILLDFAIAGIVALRFRATATTYLVSGGFVLFAIVRFFTLAAHWLVLPMLPYESIATWNLGSSVLFTLLYVLTCLVIAVGVGLIPRSLGRLAGR